eukprot:354641-Chlamydomonas_euryale.AAC.4
MPVAWLEGDDLSTLHAARAARPVSVQGHIRLLHRRRSGAARRGTPADPNRHLAAAGAGPGGRERTSRGGAARREPQRAALGMRIRAAVPPADVYVRQDALRRSGNARAGEHVAGVIIYTKSSESDSGNTKS